MRDLRDTVVMTGKNSAQIKIHKRREHRLGVKRAIFCSSTERKMRQQDRRSAWIELR